MGWDVEDMAEHVSQHFTSYWSFDQFSQQLAIHGFVPEKDREPEFWTR